MTPLRHLPSFLSSRFAAVLALVFMTHALSHAQTVGTTTADILKINEGARPAGMAGCYTAMGNDAYAIDYNPAGLSWIPASELVLLHLDSLADIEYEYLTFATAWGTGNVFAVNATYRHMPTIDNQNGTPPATAWDFLGRISYGGKLADNLRIGFTLKYLDSALGTVSSPFTASAFCFDAGAQLTRLPYGIQAGLAIQNVGFSGMTFDANSSASADALPMFIRGGIGTHQVIDKTKDLNVAVEIFKPSDQGVKLEIGGEYWMFPELFAVRAGYKFETLGAPFGGTSSTGQTLPGVPNAFQNYTLGCTLTRKINGDDFSLEIAYDPANFTSTSEDTLFFALNFKFNQLRFL
jgi:hypothetical protein